MKNYKHDKPISPYMCGMSIQVLQSATPDIEDRYFSETIIRKHIQSITEEEVTDLDVQDTMDFLWLTGIVCYLKQPDKARNHWALIWRYDSDFCTNFNKKLC